MQLTKALAPIAIAGTVAGGLLATPAAHATHIDVELLSGTAFFVGPTILSTPSATFAQSAVDLYLERLGFDTGDGDLDACRVSLGDCDAPLRLLTTPPWSSRATAASSGPPRSSARCTPNSTPTPTPTTRTTHCGSSAGRRAPPPGPWRWCSWHTTASPWTRCTSCSSVTRSMPTANTPTRRANPTRRRPATPGCCTATRPHRPVRGHQLLASR